jgi:hypothetical protein
MAVREDMAYYLSFFDILNPMADPYRFIGLFTALRNCNALACDLKQVGG